MTWRRPATEPWWIYSEKVVHPALVSDDTFAEVQQMLAGQHMPHRSRHDYALRGLLVCGLCDRRMQGHWANAAPYYRCSFATEYGLANHVQHRRNVTLRQDAILGPLDKWLFRKFDARYLAQTIDELTAAVDRRWLVVVQVAQTVRICAVLTLPAGPAVAPAGGSETLQLHRLGGQPWG